MKVKEVISDSCLICNSSDWEIIKRKSDYDVVMCHKCTFTKLSPLPTQSELARFYSKEYREKYSISEFVKDDLLKVEKLRADSITPLLLEYENDIHSYLDIGCSTGTLIESVTNAMPGIELVSAIELNENYRNYVNNKNIVNDQYGVLGKPVELCSELEDLRYDLCSLVHVLEHTMDPLLTLKVIHQKMSLNGVLYIEVPNLKTPYGWLDNNYFILYHLYYFSDDTLKKILKKVGFRIEKKIVQHSTSIAYVCKKVELVEEPDLGGFEDYNEVINLLNKYRISSFTRNFLISIGVKKLRDTLFKKRSKRKGNLGI